MSQISKTQVVHDQYSTWVYQTAATFWAQEAAHIVLGLAVFGAIIYAWHWMNGSDNDK